MTTGHLHRRLVGSFGLALTIVLLTAGSHCASTQQSSVSQTPRCVESRAAQLKESANLKAQAAHLKVEHKFDEAATALGRALAIDRILFGNCSPQSADTVALLAGVNERREDWQAAIDARMDVLAICLKQFGAKGWQTADARLALKLTAVLRDLDPLQRKRLWVADDSADAITQLEGRRKLQDAVARAQQAVDARKTVLGAEHWQVANALHRLGRLHFLLKDWKQTSAAYEEALAIFHKNLPADHPDIAMTLNDRGHMQAAVREYASAGKSHKQALAIYRNIRPKNHHDIGRSVLFLGMVQMELREYACVRRNLSEALSIYRNVRPNNYSVLAPILHNLGKSQYRLHDNLSARKTLEEGLCMYRTCLPKDLLGTGRVLNDLAVVQEELGRYSLAQKSSNEALAAFHKVVPENHLDVAASLNNLGLAQWDLFDYPSARTNHERALTIRCRLLRDDDPAIATSFSNLGLAQRDLREFESARQSHLKALSIRCKVLPKDDPETAKSFNNLGVVQSDLGEYEPALKSHKEALQMRQRALAKNHPDIAASFMNLGQVERKLRDLEAARRSFEAAFAIYKNVLPPDHLNMALIHNELGIAQRDLGDYASARKSLETAISIFRKVLPADHPYIAMTLDNIGQFDLESGVDVRADIGRLMEATDIYQKNQLRLAVSQAEQKQLATAIHSHLSLSLLLNAALLAKADAGAVYDRVLRVKGGVTAQERWAHEARNDADPESRRLLECLRRLNEQLLSLSIGDRSASSARRLDDVSTLTASLSSQRAELERQLMERSRPYRSFLTKARIDAGQVKASLPEGTALVDLVEYTYVGPPAQGRPLAFEEQRLLAFIVRRNRPIVQIELGTMEPAVEALAVWLNRIARVPRITSSRAGAELRRLIWERIEPTLKGVNTVLISPDGDLGRLPFGALPSKEPEHYLIEDYNIVVVPVPQLLPELLKDDLSPGVDPTLLAVGNVDFQARLDSDAKKESANRFSELPGTAAEVQAVHELFHAAFPDRPSEMLTRKEATKQAFVRGAPRYSTIVVCTHGFFLHDSKQNRNDGSGRWRGLEDLTSNRNLVLANPAIRSGLVFAGANWEIVGRGNAFLTALEVSEIDLRRVDLVVLSACETGLGSVSAGEGVLGLQRAFHIAGAHNVVASLWKVNDQATAALMRLLYHKLWAQKKTPTVALREAQLWILNNPGRISALAASRGLDLDEFEPLPDSGKRRAMVNRSSPSLWAGFVISGTAKSSNAMQ